MTNRIMISKSGKRFGGKKKRKRWFREGKGERVRVCVRERENVCVTERENVCVTESWRERERERVRENVRV